MPAKVLSLLVILLCAAVPAGAQQQDVQRIAAVVNDEIISLFDLNQRLDIVLTSSGLPDRPDIRQRLAPQVLRRMIDDVMKMQEAGRLELAVTDRDIDTALVRLARQNNVEPGQLDAFLARSNVNKDALVSQLEPDIAWGKVISKVIRPTIQISEEEVDDTIADIQANAGKPEQHVAEIFLRVDDPAKDGEVRQLATRLIEQIREGAPFQAVARSFSQSASAPEGGDLGWIKPGDLGPELDAALTNLEPRHAAGPIRTMGGYTILMLVETRTAKGLEGSDVELSLQQLFLPLPETPSDEATVKTLEAAKAATAGINDCGGMQKLADTLKTPLSGSLGSVKLGSLPAPLRNLVRDLPIGVPSAPTNTGQGVVVLMVCERKDSGDMAKVREGIRHNLLLQRIETAARQMMRDIRRRAFVDIRL